MYLTRLFEEFQRQFKSPCLLLLPLTGKSILRRKVISLSLFHKLKISRFSPQDFLQFFPRILNRREISQSNSSSVYIVSVRHFSMTTNWTTTHQTSSQKQLYYNQQMNAFVFLPWKNELNLFNQISMSHILSSCHPVLIPSAGCQILKWRSLLQ